MGQLPLLNNLRMTKKFCFVAFLDIEVFNNISQSALGDLISQLLRRVSSIRICKTRHSRGWSSLPIVLKSHSKLAIYANCLHHCLHRWYRHSIQRWVSTNPDARNNMKAIIMVYRMRSLCKHKQSKTRDIHKKIKIPAIHAPILHGVQLSLEAKL